MQRTAALDQSQHTQPPLPGHRLKESVCYKEVDEEIFVRMLHNVPPPPSPPPLPNDEDNTDSAVSVGCDVIMNISGRCVKEVPITENQWDQTQPRWIRIMQANDSKLLWNSIN